MYGKIALSVGRVVLAGVGVAVWTHVVRKATVKETMRQLGNTKPSKNEDHDW